MNCTEIERDDIIEQYVAGALTDTQREELEEHYFGCEECFLKLQTCRMAQSAVRRDEQSIRAAAGGRVRTFPRAMWPAVALAAAGFIAFIVLHQNTPAPPVTKAVPP